MRQYTVHVADLESNTCLSNSITNTNTKTAFKIYLKCKYKYCQCTFVFQIQLQILLSISNVKFLCFKKNLIKINCNSY